MKRLSNRNSKWKERHCICDQIDTFEEEWTGADASKMKLVQTHREGRSNVWLYTSIMYPFNRREFYFLYKKSE
jgi:hypothetical protein